ncbi:MAG: DUF21 domain-containing protein, partial [Candidatus Omnitrophica bacterium]|nr:DUF21 domain-containing protein [Candidatus Omnitrophota bacterium]MBD3269031.1 DUF21 domain-containing protein [Candidatus Omnitrophota bacterium]
MIYIYFTACLIFFVMSAFFSASEISYVSSSLLKLRHRQYKGDRRAKRVYRLLLKPERFLVTNLIGVNISNVLSASFLTFVLISAGVKSSNLWITFIFTPLVVIFADLIPKNIGRFFREEFSCRTVNIIRFFEFVFSPIIYVIETISYSIVKIFMPGVRKRSFFVTKEEIKSLVKDIEKQGGIDRGEKEAIEEVFEFRRDKIKDVCTLRREIVALDYSDSRKTILEIVNKYNFTRYPVYRNKNIAGYINIYELF